LVQGVLSRLPDPRQTDGDGAMDYQLAYLQAASELRLERHTFMGFMDVIKGLFMWVESTDERARHNLSLELDPA